MAIFTASLAAELLNADRMVSESFIYEPNNPSLSDEKLAEQGYIRLTYNGQKKLFNTKKDASIWKQYNRQFQTTLKQFLCDNVHIMFAYNGIIPPDVPDVGVIDCQIKAFTYTMPDTFANNAQFMQELATLLKSAQIMPSMTAINYAMPIPASFSPATAAFFQPVADYAASKNILAAGILDGLMATGINPIPIAASNTFTGSTGTAIMTSIIA